MVRTAAVAAPYSPGRVRGRSPGPRGVARWAAALAVAWLLPVGTHAVRLDWLLLPVIVAGTVSLLRAGRTLLDRFVLALGLLYAGGCAGGLLFSVWPWRLHPVPIAGLALSLLVLVAALTGRRPRAPLTWRAADGAVLAGTGVAAAVTLWPLLGRDTAGRLAIFMHVEDFSRHLTMYDAIRLSGGYMFLHGTTAVNHVGSVGYLAYPQGSHLVAATLENFLESGTTPGDPLVWVGNYVWLHVAGWLALCLAVLWSARWVAGPAADGRRSLVLCGLVTACLLLGDPLTIYDGSYPQEVAALAVLAPLAALVCRPLPNTREHLVVVGALLQAVSFTYYFFLPVAAVAVLGWLVVHRRRLRRHWRFAVLVGAATAALTAVAPYQNRQVGDPGSVLLAGGQAVRPAHYGLAVLVLLAAAGLLVRARRGSPAARLGLLWLTVAVGFAFAIRAYQYLSGGRTYFFHKAEHEVVILALCLLGGLLAVLPRPARAGRGSTATPGRAAARWRMVALPVAIALVVAAVAGEVTGTTRVPGYVAGRSGEPASTGRDAVAVYHAFPVSDGRTTLVLLDGGWPTFLDTIYVGVLKHEYPDAFLVAWPLRPWEGAHPLGQVADVVRTSRGPIRVVSRDPETLAVMRQLAAELPAGKLEVVDFR